MPSATPRRLSERHYERRAPMPSAEPPPRAIERHAAADKSAAERRAEPFLRDEPLMS